jgi:hypothetical protein
MRTTAVAACAAIQGAIACSLLVSTADLSGGAVENPSSMDGMASDGPRDTSDGQADSTMDGLAGDAGTFCERLGTTPVFCADFDHSTDVADGFSHHLLNGDTFAGASELDRTVLVTAPASCHLGVPSTVPGEQSGLVNRLTWFPSSNLPAASAFHFECDVRVDAVDTQSTAYLVNLSFGDGTIGVPLDNGYELSLRTAGTQGTLVESVPSGAGSTTPLALPVAVWTHLEVDVDFSVAPPMVALKLDGNVAVQRQLSAGFSPLFHEVSCGVQYYSNATVVATWIHFDDILVELR